jgi:Hemerythrin HHE cation binding domain
MVHAGDAIMNVNTPQSLKAEHEELHAELAKAINVGGATGEEAQNVAKALHPHFLKEEEYALPPLGLLPVLAGGRISPDMKAIVDMTNRLKADLNHMLLEHKEIIENLKNLTQAARSEGKDEFVRFAEKLTLHAQTEEEVLYPASILVGEYLKLELKLI